MKFNGILTLVVTVLAVVLISSACIIPIVESAQQGVYTTGNNTNYQYQTILGDDTGVYRYEVKNNAIYLNDEVLNIAIPESGRWYNVFISDRCAAQLLSTGQINPEVVLPDEAIAPIIADSDALIFNNGTLEAYYGSSDTTKTIGTYEWAMFLVDDGTLARSTVSGDKFVSNESDFYIFGNASMINSSWTSGTFILTANPVDGVKAITVSYVENSTLKYSDDITGISVSGLEVVDALHYKFTTMSLTTPVGTNNVTTNTYIPIEYKYVGSDDSVTWALFGIIPLLVFLIPIMLIVRSFGVGRD